MKKTLLGLYLILLVFSIHAQNGLEKIIVEKYYVSDTNDASGSSGTLPVGSVTYRIFVDMLPGYNFQAAYGSPTHTLVLKTSTTFFNNTDFGNITPSYSKHNAAKNTVMLDSWLSVGGACAGYLGVLKSDDNGVGTVVNADGLLQNADTSAGIPLTTQDGIIAGIVPTFTTIGLTNETNVFNDGSANGNIFTTKNGAWTCLTGAKGHDSVTNRVLIAQITTDGVFHYELNIQIGTPQGGREQYVVSNPEPGTDEITIPSLKGTYGIRPTIKIISPSADTTIKPGVEVTFRANAAADTADPSGSIKYVEFFIDGVSIGVDSTAPYTVNYTGDKGLHSLTAKATDNDGNHATSSSVNINVDYTNIENLNASSGLTFKTYPNPAKDEITLDISASGQSKNCGYNIINTEGKVILNDILGTITDRYKKNINISFLTSGQYFIVLLRDGITVSLQKITKY